MTTPHSGDQTATQFARNLRKALEGWAGSLTEAGRRANLSRSRVYEITSGTKLPTLPQLQQLIASCAPSGTRDSDVAMWTDRWQQTLANDVGFGPTYVDPGPKESQSETRTADWYWPEARTGRREQAAAEIWITSPDLYWDYEDASYSALVLDNIGRGVSYRYLVRGTSENILRAEELKRQVALLGSRADATFKVVPDEKFYWCTEHVLFDPGTSDETGLVVDLWSERDKSLKADIEMGRSRCLLFRVQFARLWDSL